MISLIHLLAMPFASLALLNLFPKKEKPMSLIERLAFPKKISEVKEKIEAKIKKLAEQRTALETEAAKEKASQAERAAKVVELEKILAEMDAAYQKEHADYVNASTRPDTQIDEIKSQCERLVRTEKSLSEMRKQIEDLKASEPFECSGGLFGTLGRVQRAPSTEAQIKQIEHEAQRLEIVLRNLTDGKDFPMTHMFDDEMASFADTFVDKSNHEHAILMLTVDDLAYLGF